MKSQIHPLRLNGLNGSNPLAFLATLGAFRSFVEACPEKEVRLSWAPSGNSWSAMLHSPEPLIEDEMVTLLHRHLATHADHPAFTVADNLKMPADQFRAYASAAVDAWMDASDVAWVEFAAAFGSDGVTDDDRMIEDTAFRTMSGAGHQHFLKFINELARNTSAEQLREAIFGPWRYQDVGFSMRWDPEDDRRYALRWFNPSGDAARTVRGANRLAIEGLRLFPTVPTSSHLATTAFSGRKANNTFWTWPIWETPISLDTCRSLLAHAELANPQPSAELCRAIGMVGILKSQRITTGKFRNFTPAQVVWS
jgi:hypothetical protein